MMNYSSLYTRLAGTRLQTWASTLPDLLEQRVTESFHGDYHRWRDAIEELPQLPAAQVRLDEAVVSVTNTPCDEKIKAQIASSLQVLHPWRKGPYSLHGVYVDTEWRSDKKWDRLAGSIEPLSGRRVLDVGCGNGYHCWRMLGAGAAWVIGIDPTLLYVMQYIAISKLLGDPPAYVLPFALEDLPPKLNAFDTVFSLGVLYHRRSPIDHLYALRDSLRSGGQLVLETLVIDGDGGEVLMPANRYAKMRNVWFIPTVSLLKTCIMRSGFKDVKLIDVSKTDSAEQRSTQWMRFDSLATFLSPKNNDLTVEGLPAPKRAILCARTV